MADNATVPADYATVQDIVNLKRPLTAAEQTRAGYLIPAVCNEIRYEARKVGKDFDEMIAGNPALADVAKAVTVDIYSLPNASGRIGLWPSDLKQLGLRRQRIGSLPLWKGR